MERKRYILVLGSWAAVVALGGAVVAASDDDGKGDSAPSTTTAPVNTIADPTVVPVGEFRVTGTANAATIDGSVAEALAMPLSADPAAPGAPNGGTINDATIDGGIGVIEWNAGRSLVVTGNGSLAIEPSTFFLSGSFLTVDLGGSTHSFLPGSYRIDTPVAVSSNGVAEAKDTIAFSVTSAAAFSVRGSVVANLPVGTWTFTGPGTLRLEGDLMIETSEGTSPASVVELPTGGYELTLVGQGDGTWTVQARLQGAVVSS